MRWLLIVAPLLITLAACKGPVGPEGPQGPPGEAGEVGPEAPLGAVRLFATGTIGADGTVTVDFPPGLGSLGLDGTDVDLPSLTCYQSETGAVWVPVTEALCTVAETPAGNLAIFLANGTPGWLFYFVIVF